MKLLDTLHSFFPLSLRSGVYFLFTPCKYNHISNIYDPLADGSCYIGQRRLGALFQNHTKGSLFAYGKMDSFILLRKNFPDVVLHLNINRQVVDIMGSLED